MSHFTVLPKARIVDTKAFITAMAELGMTEVEKNTTIRAWESSDAPLGVDVFCRFPGTKVNDRWNATQYGIGLKKNGAYYDMIADWALTGYYLPEKIKGQLPAGFPQKDGPGGGAFKACEALRGMALKLTTKHTIVSAYKLRGFIANVKENADKSLHITLSR